MKNIIFIFGLISTAIFISCSTCSQHRAFAEKVLERPDDFEMLFENSIYYDSTFNMKWGGSDFLESIKFHNKHKDYTYYETRSETYGSIEDSIKMPVRNCSVIFSSTSSKGYITFVFVNKLSKWKISRISWGSGLFPDMRLPGR